MRAKVMLYLESKFCRGVIPKARVFSPAGRGISLKHLLAWRSLATLEKAAPLGMTLSIQDHPLHMIQRFARAYGRPL
jgi:hypothetical protein